MIYYWQQKAQKLTASMKAQFEEIGIIQALLHKHRFLSGIVLEKTDLKK